MDLFDKERVLEAKVSRKQFVSSYLQLWKGSFKFSRASYKLTGLLVMKYLELYETGLRDPYLSDTLFSTKVFQGFKSEFNNKSQVMYNLKRELKQINIISESGDGFRLNPVLIPVKSITFKYEFRD